jgi:hypothetical protein
MYARQIDTFLGSHDRSSLLLLDFADISNNLESLCQKCIDFLGLDAFDFDKISAVNVTPRQQRFGLSRKRESVLRSRLAPDMRRLEEIYGFPVDHWGF